MELIDLENISSKEKLSLINFKMKKSKSRIIDKFIFMDYSNITTYTEEKCSLAEELRSLLLFCLLLYFFLSNGNR